VGPAIKQFGFCAAMLGILVDRVNATAFATITTITTGGIILLITSLAPPQFLRRVKIGPIEAELFELKKDVASQARDYQQARHIFTCRDNLSRSALENRP